MNEKTLRAYSIVKLSDGSFTLRNLENPTETWLIGKKYLASTGKRYVIGSRKLIRLKKELEKCVLNDWCIKFQFDGETYTFERMTETSSELEKSPLYEVKQGADPKVFYLANGNRSLFYDVTIGTDYYIDCRNGNWGTWKRFINKNDITQLEEIMKTLAECLKNGWKVKFGVIPGTRQPKVKVIEAA